MSQRVAITQQQRAATIATARAEVAAAKEARTAATQRVTQLPSGRAELNQQIAAPLAMRNEAPAAARAARTVNDRRAGLNQAPSAYAERHYAAAMEGARIVAGTLAKAQAHLQGLNGP